MIRSRVVNVIETTNDSDVTYFTLEGVMIGGFSGGNRKEPVQPVVQPEKPKGGVVKSRTPEQVRKDQERESEQLLTAEGRLKHIKDSVV